MGTGPLAAASFTPSPGGALAGASAALIRARLLAGLAVRRGEEGAKARHGVRFLGVPGALQNPAAAHRDTGGKGNILFSLVHKQERSLVQIVRFNGAKDNKLFASATDRI